MVLDGKLPHYGNYHNLIISINLQYNKFNLLESVVEEKEIIAIYNNLVLLFFLFVHNYKIKIFDLKMIAKNFKKIIII